MRFTEKTNGTRKAFTLIELLVVIAIIAILASLLLPALQRAKDQSRQIKCIANKRQMQIAWQMYADDYKSVMVLNAPLNVTAALPQDIWCPSQGPFWAANSYNTNVAAFAQCLLAPYLVGQVAVYKCPGDTILSGGGQDRLRSTSMNSQMGWQYLQAHYPGLNFSAPFRIYIKVTDVTAPTPAYAFVFADETMYTMDDGFMQMPTPTGPGFPNAPAHYHCGSGTFSFVDGHAEARKWRGNVLPKLPYEYNVSSSGPITTTANDPDFLYLSNRCSCISNQNWYGGPQ